MLRKIPALGCCGLDCGLCPRYYTEGSSKCPGCGGADFETKHPSCSFITCCVKKKNLEVCAECADFPCVKFEKETGEADSFVTHRRVMQNQSFIKQYGVASFVEQQSQRMSLLGKMLDNYDDGNCKSFFCLAATLLSLQSLNGALVKVEEEIQAKAIGKDDTKSKAKIIKEILNTFAKEENEELKLRKPKK
ncbi:MAG TPA: DUF3795 domain-containing protein [Bacillota bacterium]|nr:DUF3795 domain-containing protein [Bacillota bacterium]